MYFDKPRHDDESCIGLFKRFYLDANSLLDDFAPEGWTHSQLFYAFHPTPRMQYQEALRIHRNLSGIFGREASRDEPKLVDFTDCENEVKPAEEIVYLTGLCLWDIFSNNHEVIDGDGKVYDIGSFRGAGGFLADYINRHFASQAVQYDYLDFYMGTIYIHHEVSLLPVYLWIFEYLKKLECDWIYSFPRLGLLRLGESRASADPLEYDPETSLAKELTAQKIDAFARELDEVYEDALDAAKHEALPGAVAAYQEVYRKLPQGWPHPED